MFVFVAACGSTTSTSVASSTTAITTTADPSTSIPQAPTTTPSTVPASLDPVVRTGAQVLTDTDFAGVAGLRVGLITHQSSVVEIDGVQTHLSDALATHPAIDLVALFGPEHGIRGIADAGELIDDAVDEQTGVPIFSLFGETRRPTPEMLEGIDVLVYDLQDVGTRYYT